MSQLGKPAEALKEHQKALAIRQKLADASPVDPEIQSDLARSHNYIGRLHAREKRFAEAFAALNRCLAILQKLVDANPTNTESTSYLGWGHAFRGAAHVRAGQVAEAAADLRRALTLWEKAKPLDSEMLFERARTLALLAGLGGEVNSGVTKDEAAAFADQAVASLRDAINAGWNLPNDLKEPDFDAIRGRDDFKKLVAEVEAKAEKQ